MIQFLTTATSGSQSIFRILEQYSKLIGHDLQIVRGAMFKNFEGVNSVDKFVVNIRDPRDIWCNQFYWLVQHPAPNEQVKEERKRRYEMGIDSSVLKSARAFAGDSSGQTILKLISEHSLKDNICYVSYAQLCIKFDEMIDNLNNFFGVIPHPEMMDIIQLESPKGLEHNKKWIGNDWKGCDIMPGRYKTELKPETIQELNEILKDYIRVIQTAEIEELKYLYE